MTKKDWANMLKHECRSFPKIVLLVYLGLVPAAITYRHAWGELSILEYLGLGLLFLISIYIWRVIYMTVGVSISEIMRIRKKNTS